MQMTTTLQPDFEVGLEGQWQKLEQGNQLFILPGRRDDRGILFYTGSWTVFINMIG